MPAPHSSLGAYAYKYTVYVCIARPPFGRPMTAPWPPRDHPTATPQRPHGDPTAAPRRTLGGPTDEFIFVVQDCGFIYNYVP